jgi:hypothetical protein
MSLLDTPKTVLNPEIWTELKTLRPEVKEHILALLSTLIPLNKTERIVVMGSSATYQYSDTSDLDCNVVAIPGESYDAWHKLFKAFNEIPHLLPGTLHQINFFFQEHSSENADWSNAQSAYDVMRGTWLKTPPSPDKIGNPEIKYAREISYGTALVDAIEMRVQHISDAENRGDTTTARILIRELMLMFKDLENNRKTYYRYATNPAYEAGNIIYKVVDSSRFSELMHEMVNLFDKEWNPANE